MTTKAMRSPCYVHDYRTEYSATQAETQTMHTSHALFSLSSFFFIFTIVPLRTTIFLG